MIKQALIMAAGEARRMRPLTDNLPKPLLILDGKPLLTHIITHLLSVGVEHIIINGYHAIEPLKNYMKDIQKLYPSCRFTLSEETELLETGGGAIKTLDYLDTEMPFYMINGDAFWINPPTSNSLKLMASAWESNENDILLLLQMTNTMNLTGSIGDYTINDNKAIRSIEKKGSHMFTGIRICNPNILKNYKCEKFSFLKIMDDVQSNAKLGGLNHTGEWYHISTPSDLDEVNHKFFGKTS